MTPGSSDDSLHSCQLLLKEIELRLKSDPGSKKLRHELSKCHATIGSLHFSKGQITEGTNSFLSSLNILEQISKTDPGNGEWYYELCKTYETLGSFLQTHGDPAFAELFYSQAIAIRKKNQGELHPDYITSICRLAKLYISMGKYTYAEDLLLQQIALFDTKWWKEPPEYIACVEQLAELYSEINDHAASEFLFTKVVSLKKKVFGEKHPEYIAAFNRLNSLYKNIGRLNNISGNMVDAMKGVPKNTGNPALTKIDHMLGDDDYLLKEFLSKKAEKKTNHSAGDKISENVNFAVSFPHSMLPGESYILDVWLFVEEQRNKLLSRVKEESIDAAGLKSSGPAVVERGTIITARLSIENLITEPTEKTLTWTGELNNSSFMVNVPENIKEGGKMGHAYFYINGVEISRLYFKVMIPVKQTEFTQPMNGVASCPGYKTAFASYASVDRDEVLSRVQGLEKAGIDVFMDVRNLRSGERYEDKLLEKIRVSDIFYLFWSTAAKKSDWVRKEWEYALNNKGIDFINPIPLEPPDVVPPPPELGQVLHFGDWTLAYKRSKPVN